MEVSDEEKDLTEFEGNSSYGSSSSKPSEYAVNHKKEGLGETVGLPTAPPLKQTAKERPQPIPTSQKPSHPPPPPKAPSPPPLQHQAQKPSAPKTTSGDTKAFKAKLTRWGPYRQPPPPPPPPGHPYPWYPAPRQNQWNTYYQQFQPRPPVWSNYRW